jgi:hypothetical protein
VTAYADTVNQKLASLPHHTFPKGEPTSFLTVCFHYVDIDCSCYAVRLNAALLAPSFLSLLLAPIVPQPPLTALVPGTCMLDYVCYAVCLDAVPQAPFF